MKCCGFTQRGMTSSAGSGKVVGASFKSFDSNSKESVTWIKLDVPHGSVWFCCSNIRDSETSKHNFWKERLKSLYSVSERSNKWERGTLINISPSSFPMQYPLHGGSPNSLYFPISTIHTTSFPYAQLFCILKNISPWCTSALCWMDSSISLCSTAILMRDVALIPLPKDVGRREGLEYSFLNDFYSCCS